VKRRAVVTGMVGSYPVGGVAWDYGQYLAGLQRMGWEVWYLEDTGARGYDPQRQDFTEGGDYGAGFLAASLPAFGPGLGERWHFRAMDGSRHGVPQERIEDAVASADLFLNVSGGTLLREAYLGCPRKVLIDSDPGFNHFVNYPRWDAQPGWEGSHGYRAHDAFFTYAESMGAADCTLPDMGLDWQPTRPLVVPEMWPAASPLEDAPWTTVMTWNNYRKPVTWQGRGYGSKEMEFPKIAGLPRRFPGSRFQIALAGHGNPDAEMREQGWEVVDSHAVSRTPQEYSDYLCGSRGELSVAKNVYVATRSGWSSCRSICYLAAGLPAVVQDTGFSSVLPTGEGLLAFDDLDGAIAAVQAVQSDPQRHARAAREIAREHFAADRVLTRLLAAAGLD